ncbi:MAG: hypothetical protein KBC15_03790 [Candidatus Levybacteria bacterium]|nr:hypothetical protein [Candidatus Levybacteria bacterium]
MNIDTIHIPRMFLFDVDGPIVDPKTEKVTQIAILKRIAAELHSQRPIALITGRATSWLIDNVVSKIENLVLDPNDLKYLFISAEFGGSSINYDDGSRHIHTDPTISIPPALLSFCEELVSGKYSKTMTFEKKETQFTAKLQKGIDLAAFNLDRIKFAEEVQNHLDLSSLSEHYEIHNDRIAVNIRDKRENKVFATEQVLNWVIQKRIEPESFVIFGDSRGDFEIADAAIDNELVQEHDYSVKFVYLGEKEDVQDLIEADPGYEIDVRTNDDLALGTLEVLNELPL